MYRTLHCLVGGRTGPVVVMGFVLLLAARTAGAQGGSGLGKSDSSRQQKRRPNVLLILTDDQGYGDLRCHGNRLIETPVLDRLARQSTRFDRFMVSPLCSMTRASLLTGRYNLRTGCASVTRGLEAVRPEETTIAEILRSAGYATGCFGKWHIGEHYPSHPRGQGFDEFFGMPQGHWDNYFDPTLEHDGAMVGTKGYITDVLTDVAIAFIRRHRGGPFFCYVPYNAPHTPMQLSDRLFDKYKARGVDDRTASVYGMVENIDHNVGLILRELDRLGIANDTIVFFLSDNGAEGPEGSRFNAGMRGMKGSVHEGGVRVPLFVRWPGHIAQDRQIGRLVAHIDILPTIAELAGASVPSNVHPDGHSFAGLLTGDGGRWPEDRTVFTHNPGWRQLVGVAGKPILESVVQRFPGSVRTERWRAVNEGNGWQLFDMRRDPGEADDVAGRHRDVVERLAGAYGEWFDGVTSRPIVRPRIRVGYREWPRETLNSAEAYFSGKIRWYNRYGFAHDWLTDWTDPSESIWWEVDVVRGGRFEVTVRYACRDDVVGSRLRLVAGESSVEGKIKKAHTPRPVQRPTRIKKRRFIQTFAEQTLGRLKLDPGTVRIQLEFADRRGTTSLDIESVVLSRVE